MSNKSKQTDKMNSIPKREQGEGRGQERQHRKAKKIGKKTQRSLA